MKFSLCALLIAAMTLPASAQLYAAAGKIDITPDRSVFIAGYGSNRKSEGVHDPLWARCLVLKNGSETIALVSCDLIGLIRLHVTTIRSMVRSVPAARLLIGSTHTHSGPDTYGQWGPNFATSGVDKPWLENTLKRIAELVEQTAAGLKPAKVRFGSVKEVNDCSVNARVKQFIDTELAAMQVRDASNGVIATLVNFACHPEVLNNKQITSDFPHWLRQDVEAKFGGIAIYMNGAQGGMVTADIKNEDDYPKGEAWPEAERIGKTLARKTIECLEGAADSANTQLTFGQRIFRVRMENPAFRLLIKNGVLPGGLLDGEDVQTEVSRFTVGAAEFITLPGEVLPNIGLYLKSKMTGMPKFQLGLTGDALGYILTPQDFVMKLYAYEARTSVGPDMGRLMEENLLSLIAPGRSRTP